MNKLIPASEYCLSIFDGTHDTPKPVKEGRLLITSKHIAGGFLDASSAYLISDRDYQSIQKRSAVSQWDILFSMIGSVGEVYLEQNADIPYAIKNIGVFSCKAECKARWLYYYLISPAAKLHIQRFLNGAVQKFLPLGALRNFPVPMYDKDKDSIVEILSVFDNKINCNKRMILELESMAKLIYDYWFVQFDYPDIDGKPYKKAGGKMTFNPNLKIDIPEGWGDILVGEILDKTPASTKIMSQDILWDGDIPVVDQGQDFICGFTDERSSLIEPTEPHVIFGDHTRLVKLINFKYARGADGTQALISKDARMPGYLMYQTISNIDLSNYGYARHFKFLKQSRILLPDQNTAQKYHRFVAPLYEKKRQLLFENFELTKLRNWLLPMLMNGQVNVT